MYFPHFSMIVLHENSLTTAVYFNMTQICLFREEMGFTLRVFRTGEHLLRTEDWSLAVVGEDPNTRFQHSHCGK